MTTVRSRGRYQGKRVAAKRRPPRPAAGTGSRGARSQVTPQQRRRTIQLVVAGGIFVFLVMLKLLVPQSLTTFAAAVRDSLSRDADFKAAFSAVGRAIAGEESVGDSLQDAYTAVFAPEQYHAAQASAVCAAAKAIEMPADRLYNRLTGAAGQTEVEETVQTSQEQMVSGQTLVYFSSATPANVSYEQVVLGFAYTTPVDGTLTSTFGYRDHPIYGEERFHYGLDIANGKGTAICAFADGTVKATGESSSLGRYLMITHPNGITTLYAHCDRVVVTAGTEVSMGQKVAEMGDTGIATGSHLHFEILDGDTYLNPIYYVEVH